MEKEILLCDCNEIKEKIMKEIKNYLPQEVNIASVESYETIKNNGKKLNGMVIRKEGCNIAPVIYLDSFISKIENGVSFELVMKELADLYIQNASELSDMEERHATLDLMDYDAIKDKIVCKLINLDRNIEFLQDKAHSFVSDLAVIYQIEIMNDEFGCTAHTITKRLLESYDITVEQLHEQAISNMRNRKCLFEKLSEFMGWQDPGVRDHLWILTSKNFVNGASLILIPEVRDKILRQLGDVYIMPSSIYEMLIVKKSLGFHEDEINSTIRDGNKRVQMEEYLSSHAYQLSDFDAVKADQ